jgi:hypothetical protein
MRNFWLIWLLILCGIGVVGVGYDSLFMPGLIADGSYPLAVTLRPSGKHAISSIFVSPEGRVEVAEQNLAWMLDKRIDPNSIQNELWCPIKKDPFDGGDLTVNIPFSEHIRTPMFWPSYVKNETQFQALLVFVILDDGSRAGKVVELPHRSQSRAITVALP